MGVEDYPQPAEHTQPQGEALQPLVTRIRQLFAQLQALQHELGAYFDRLAAVDWQALAQQGKLAGIPRLSIERTIMDARGVLANGLRELAEELRLLQEGYAGMGKHAIDVPARLQSMIRRYTDAPADIRTRYQRLVAWVAKIDQLLRERGEPPLSAQVALPHHVSQP